MMIYKGKTNMSADNYKEEYHLTSKGWILGTRYYFGKIQGDSIERPNNTVETWIYHETLSSIYSKSDIEFYEIWQNSTIDTEVIAHLHQKYPKPTD